MSELIDRQALKDAVRRYAGEPIKAKDKKCQAICLDMLGTIDAQPAASPWHRVEDELPKEKNWVLVWHTGYATPKKAKFIVDVIPEFLFDGGGGAWELDGWSDNKGKVTHWMPLPEPPKEDV